MVNGGGAVRCYFRGDPAPTHSNVEEILHQAYDRLPGIHEIALSYDAGKGYKVLHATSQVSSSGTNSSLQKFEVKVGADIREAVIQLLVGNGLPVVEV